MLVWMWNYVYVRVCVFKKIATFIEYFYSSGQNLTDLAIQIKSYTIIVMAVVLNSEENSYFSGPLRRTHSQPKFITPQSSCTKSLYRSISSNSFREIIQSSSIATLQTSSPRIIHSSYTSCSLPLDDQSPRARYQINGEDHEINFPSFDEVGYYSHADDFEPPISPPTEGSYTVSPTLSPTSNSTSTNLSRPQSPDLIEHAEDDTAIRIQPSRHVDYLSHNWSEEDIWLSWKHVVSRRKAYNNSARLENASWRSWIKAKYKLKTVSPEALNWLKDCDVTWLYGPLQTFSHRSFHAQLPSPVNSTHLSKNNSFLNKKPILKKRSMSELMLQKSLSNSSLLKQAAAAVQSQQSEKTIEYPRVSTSIYEIPPCHPSDPQIPYLSSISSSDLPSPMNSEKKRIHFNEQVEQCIALDLKGDDEDEPLIHEYDNSDSDDDGIMMKKSTNQRKLPPMVRPKASRPAPRQESNKTIAMLPSTTLKYRPDTPDDFEVADSYHNELWDGSVLSPSASQETLRPCMSSRRIAMRDVIDDEDEDDIDWEPTSLISTPRENVTVAKQQMRIIHSSSEIKQSETVELRRTSSGMFMPHDENEEDSIASEGLFGRVIETVNTAKDIAHVIWNVGWRR